MLRTLHHERLMALHEAYITPRYLVLIAESCGSRNSSVAQRPVAGHLGARAGVGGAGLGYPPDTPIPPDSGIQRRRGHLCVQKLLQAWTTSMAATCCTWTSARQPAAGPSNALKIVDFGSAQPYNPGSAAPGSPHRHTGVHG